MPARLSLTASLVLSLCALSSVLAPSPAAAAGPFVVNKTGDASDRNIGNGTCDSSKKSGNQCTFRAAIQEANSGSAIDTINFNIATTPRVIKPASPLPPITTEVVIDGYSQPGSSPNTQASGDNAVLKITLDGVNAGNGANGLEVGGFKSTVKGLVIQRFSGSGIVLVGQSDKVFGNFIGTTAAGTAARGNGTGITLSSPGGTVGSGNPEDRNLISGNNGDGVHVSGSEADNAFIVNNLIGTKKNGTAALGNGGVGVRVEGEGAQVGFITAGYGNVISANGGYGVLVLQNAGTNGSKIAGNLIGTDVTGSADLGNDGGVMVQANGVTIGGTTTAARNVISGNDGNGVTLSGSTSCVIVGNYIGTNAAGTAALGNGLSGIYMTGSTDTVIGGTVAGARNVISGNGQDGVGILTDSSRTKVQGNRIGTKADGTGDLGNVGDGVIVTGRDNEIGGSASGAGNLISGNDSIGVRVSGVGTVIDANEVTRNVIKLSGFDGIALISTAATTVSSNLIQSNGRDGVAVFPSSSGSDIVGNQIFGNNGLGINLIGGTEDAFGVTANDSGDPDTGANNLQNFPVAHVSQLQRRKRRDNGQRVAE